MALAFSKQMRLTRSSEFLLVKTEGRSYGGRFMVFGVLRRPQNAKGHGASGATSNATLDAASGNASKVGCRVGLITSRKVGGAVVRNRVRRRLRELARASMPLLAVGEASVGDLWLVVVARRSAAEASFADLQREWLKLARRAGLLPHAQSEPRSAIAPSVTPIIPVTPSDSNEEGGAEGC